MERGIKPTSPLRRFYVLRTVDVSGIAGLGRIVEGVVLASGRVILEWRPPVSSVVTFDDFDQFRHLYLHEGHNCNELIFVDEEPA